jgi:hypothetical protein
MGSVGGAHCVQVEEPRGVTSAPVAPVQDAPEFLVKQMACAVDAGSCITYIPPIAG